MTDERTYRDQLTGVLDKALAGGEQDSRPSVSPDVSAALRLAANAANQHKEDSP